MNNSNIIMYTTEDGLTKIETTFEDDTVWLSLDQMAELFQRDKSTISRHIKKIFEERELQRNSVVANFATTAADPSRAGIIVPAEQPENEDILMLIMPMLLND